MNISKLLDWLKHGPDRDFLGEYRILGELEFVNPRKRSEVVTVGFLLSPDQIRSVFREIRSCEERGYSTDCR